MNPLVGSIATLAVAVIFYIWQLYNRIRMQKQRHLRKRVAYMLWVMANEDEEASCETTANGAV
jgi:hypothetical protein